MAVTGAEAQISDALLWYVEQIVTVPAIGVAYPNTVFKPGTAAPYMRVSVMPNMADATGIEFGSDINHQGLLQISIFWPAQQGEIKPLRVASQIVAAFRRGTTIVRNGLKVLFEQQPQVAPGLSQADWYQVPITARWRALAADPGVQ